MVAKVINSDVLRSKVDRVTKKNYPITFIILWKIYITLGCYGFEFWGSITNSWHTDLLVYLIVFLCSVFLYYGTKVLVTLVLRSHLC